jgi:hypothetical protein
MRVAARTRVLCPCLLAPLPSRLNAPLVRGVLGCDMKLDSFQEIYIYLVQGRHNDLKHTKTLAPDKYRFSNDSVKPAFAGK